MLDFKFILRTLKYRNYRLFFYGQGISLIGTWMQGVAISWMVYRLTHSAFLLGVIGATVQIPTFLFTPFFGVLVDRWNRRRILLVTQILAMTQAFILTILTITGNITIWQIIALSIFLGAVNAFDMPTRQSFVVEMVDRRDDLGNAIALNSLMFNSARLLGPAIAGVIVAIAGEGICFFLNGVSYFAIILALLKMKIEPRKTQGQDSHLLKDLKEGFAYTFGFAPIRNVLLLFALVNLMGVSYSVLMPVFAKEILGGGPHTFGFLISAIGVGALMGAFYVASRKDTHGLKKIIPSAAGIFGIGLVAFSFSRILWLSLLLLMIAGFGLMVQIASSNTALQVLTDDDKRGRVMSFYTMAFMGMVTFGSLLVGGLASRIGTPNTLFISGASCILGALFFARKISSMSKRMV